MGHRVKQTHRLFLLPSSGWFLAYDFGSKAHLFSLVLKSFIPLFGEYLMCAFLLPGTVISDKMANMTELPLTWFTN